MIVNCQRKWIFVEYAKFSGGNAKLVVKKVGMFYRNSRYKVFIFPF